MSDAFEELVKTSPYVALRQVVSTRSAPIVAFVGSGMSAAAGVPTWPALRDRLVKALRDKASAATDTSEVNRLAGIADKAQSAKSYWASFAMLHAALGDTSYRSELLSALSPADKADIPGGYVDLWKLPLRGIVTLNLDSFPRRSYSAARPGDDLKAFLGREAPQLSKLVHGQTPFVFNLHGVIDDYSSWIFTSDELSQLYSTPGYTQLLQTIFSTCSVLFLGISADDRAVGGPLEKLAQHGVAGPQHFWLTSRSDKSTSDWAESCGVRIVTYAATGGDHSAVEKALSDLQRAAPLEPSTQPVASDSFGGAETWPSVEELLTADAESMRVALNRMATSILSLEPTEAESKFRELVDEYEEVIHRAEFSSAKPGRNTFFGHTLLRDVAKGAFGKVYEAVDPAGEKVAIKILRPDVRQNIALLTSYRRGVKAMEILGGHQVVGMVPYRTASELPPFVSMDWVDGPNLSDAKAARLLDDWTDILWTVIQASEIVRRAHALPEGILHRDLRPANIMLENAWSNWEDRRVVVLDFDLATHRTAREESVLAEESAIGYLAPEQLSDVGVSTRSTLVDVFGLGMTLLFLCSGDEPEAYAQRRKDYEEYIARAVTRPGSAVWKSTPKRVGRLIEQATRDVQQERVDMSQLIFELLRIFKVETKTDSSAQADADQVAEELCARAATLAEYQWVHDESAALRRFANGLQVVVRGVTGSRVVEASFEWAAGAAADRSGLAKYTRGRTDRAAAALRKTGWRVDRVDTETGSALLRVSTDRAAWVGGLDTLAAGLDEASSAMGFEAP